MTRSALRSSVNLLILSAALATPASRAATVLMVTDLDGSYNAEESARKSQLEAWGYTVAAVHDNASQAVIDAAVAAADVVYVPGTIDDWQLLYKLRTATRGVVTETPGLDQEFGFAAGDGYTQSWNAVENVDNSHAVTAGLATGTVTIVTSNQNLALNGNTKASGMQTLATLNFGGLALGAIETGGALADAYGGNGTATARRVRLPWGLASFSAFNSNGLAILQNALSWAAGGNDLLLHLKLNETSGTAANDSSDYNRDGSVVGTANWIAARRHNGFDFNGSTKIEVNSLLGNPTSFTVACWARVDATDSAGAEGISVGDYILLRPHDVTNGVALAHFYSGGGSFQTVAASTNYVGRGWHHLAATFDDSANSFKLYVDGTLVAMTSTTSSVAWSGLGTKTRIGAHGNTNTNLDLDGAIDDARVYSRALSPSEIADLYGLVGHWKLAETAGTTATDSSGKALNGAHTGGTTVGQSGPYPGAGQYAAGFDGSNDYVNGASATNYAAFADGFSIVGWVNLDSHVDYAAVLENGATTDSCSLAFSGTGQVRVVGRSSGGLQIHTTAATLPLGRWVHVVGTHDGTTFKAYVDGQLVSSASNAFALTTPAGNLTLGVSLQGNDEYLDGRLQDVRLYNRAIAADEVAEIYGLVGHWTFNEGSGTALADSSGAGAAAAFNSGSPDWTTGVYGDALEFDGVTDDAQTSAAFTPPSVGTVAFWMRSNGPPAARQRPFGVGADWEAWQDPDGIVRFDLCGNGYIGGFETVSAPATAGAWYHLVAMFDAVDDSYAIYVNGALDKSGTSTENLTAQAAAALSLGTRTGSTERFAGRLDDFRVYNRKLSPWEVYQIYGLMAWYKLDETSGTIAVDATGRGNDGAYGGAPTLGVVSNGNPAMGTAVDFNGTNAVQIPGMYEQSASVSAAAWVRLDAADSLGADVVSLGDHFKLTLLNGSPGALAAYYNGSAWISAPGPQYTGNAGWHHFAAVLRENDSLKLYVDGNEAATLALSGAISYAGLGANTRIASHGNGGTNSDLDGRVDDVRIFNRAMQPDEVFQLYRGTRIDGIRILQWVEAR